MLLVCFDFFNLSLFFNPPEKYDGVLCFTFSIGVLKVDGYGILKVMSASFTTS